jgi:diaminohydroxyphosphoribosylaminopyrimidine deaminase/5-amino-6-(5-phosphoribosylamino)uracil reductase
MNAVSRRDLTYMRQALAGAARHRARVHPNPMVGCLVVDARGVAGTGAHEYFGGPHAEVNALAAAGPRARGATLYVTLEPCAHWGKTPPCTEAIIAAGIARVVAAMADPNPRVSGAGFARLRSAGLDVVTGVLERDARRLNTAYLRSVTTDDGPDITIKAAMTLDGKIAAQTGDSKWITGPQARAYVHRLRSTQDAVLVGIGTVIADDPHLTSHGRGRNPVRVVIDPDLRIPPHSHILDNSAPKAVIYSTRRMSKKASRLKRMGAIMIRIQEQKGRIPFPAIVRALADLRIRRILVEGGGETIARILESGLSPQVAFFIAPRIIGGRDARTPVEGNGLRRMAGALSVADLRVRRIGPDILITGRIDREHACSPALSKI